MEQGKKRTAWIIWSTVFGVTFVACVSSWFYPGLCEEVARIVVGDELPRVSSTVFVFRIFAIMLAIAVVFVHRILFSQNKIDFRSCDEKEIAKWLGRNTILWGLTEAIAFFGVLLSGTGFGFVTSLPFFLVSLLLFFITRPRTQISLT